MASFAELLGGQSLGRLEDAGYNAPKSEREGGVSFVPARRGHAANATSGASRQASAGSRENAPQSPSPVSEPAPRRACGVRSQTWEVTSGYSSHSRTGEVVEKKCRNVLGYAAVAEVNCRRYCEGGENWYRLTQLALDGDVSPLVERGYLSQADADDCEPLEAAARAFANAHFTPDMRGGRAVDELGDDAPTWEKLRLAYLIACAPAGAWQRRRRRVRASTTARTVLRRLGRLRTRSSATSRRRTCHGCVSGATCRRELTALLLTGSCTRWTRAWKPPGLRAAAFLAAL